MVLSGQPPLWEYTVMKWEREKPKDLYVEERGRSPESMAVRKTLMWVACLQPRAMVMLDLAAAKGRVWV